MDPPQPQAPAGSSPRCPLVLQVSPLPRSNEPEEFFYDPFADVVAGNFTAAWLFFIENGYSVVTHDCPGMSAFQALFPGAMIRFYSSLRPHPFLIRDQAIPAALCEELYLAASSPSGTVIAAPPQPGFTRSLLDWYTMDYIPG
jgi:hypothetical protein